MNKNLIAFLILSNIYITISLKAGFLDYDEITNFDENNSEFSFDYTDGDSTFILVIIKTKNIMNYRCKCGTSEIADSSTTHSSFIIKAKKGSCTILLSADSVFKLGGTILIHDINKEINYDYASSEIKAKYAYDNILESNEKVPDIIYSLPTFQEDFKAKFTYPESSININNKKFTLSNPIRVCQNKDCRDDVKVYQFVKGKTYKIHIKFEELKFDSKKLYATPQFNMVQASDSDKVDEGNNLKMKVSLISLLLLLIF